MEKFGYMQILSEQESTGMTVTSSDPLAIGVVWEFVAELVPGCGINQLLPWKKGGTIKKPTDDALEISISNLQRRNREVVLKTAQWLADSGWEPLEFSNIGKNTFPYVFKFRKKYD